MLWGGSLRSGTAATGGIQRRLEKASEAAHTAVNTPMKQVFDVDESCPEMTRLIIKQPYLGHVYRSTLPLKMNWRKSCVKSP